MITLQGRQYDSMAAARADIARQREAAAAIPAVPDAPDIPAPVSHDAPPPKQKSMPARYRPRTLKDLVGQPSAVAIMTDYVTAPYPVAVIMSGETGTGKTSAAWAMAADLGCNIDATPAEFGGVFSIASGDHNADALRDLWPALWNVPFESANGWKVLIVNEVEQLNSSVERLWLDKLEDLPPSTVVIFTTNSLSSLPTRFVDRCTVIEFQSSADDLCEPARGLARSIWQAETNSDIPADVMERVISRSIQAGKLSFRRVVQNLVPLIAAKGMV